MIVRPGYGPALPSTALAGIRSRRSSRVAARASFVFRLQEDHGVGGERCESCGRATDVHNRHVRFRLPDPVLHSPAQERAEGSWLSHADAASSVMMPIPGAGPFIRALLPVRLTGGYPVTYCVGVAGWP